jgi:hypothetical protein
MKRRGLWCGLVVAAAVVGAAPAVSQDVSLRLPPPPTAQAITGAYRLQWEDLAPGAVEDRMVSFAWYYATKADGSDRKRIVTSLRDDFANFRANWTCPGPFPFDWSLTKREIGTVLKADKGASPLYSNNAIPANSVVSLKVRPLLGASTWGVTLRVQKLDTGLEFRHDGNKLRIFEAGEQIDAFIVGLPPGWYWYEIGLQNKKGRDVEIRVRIFDEDRTRLVASRCLTHKLKVVDLKKPGGIALSGPANFAELYVDPWASRYADDSDNALTWDTTAVPDGQYFVIAEVADGKAPPRIVASPFRVEVRNRDQAAGN